MMEQEQNTPSIPSFYITEEIVIVVGSDGESYANCHLGEFQLHDGIVCRLGMTVLSYFIL